MQPDQAITSLLTQMYRDFNARDAGAVLAAMTPDVEWPKAFLGGYVQGPAAVRAYWADQWASINPHVEPTGYELLPNGRVAVTVHQVVHDLAGALLMDGQVQHVYMLRDGLIARMDLKVIE